jgi:hypothetical protein
MQIIKAPVRPHAERRHTNTSGEITVLSFAFIQRLLDERRSNEQHWNAAVTESCSTNNNNNNN